MLRVCVTVENTFCVYSKFEKKIILFNLSELWQNIYLPAAWLGKYYATSHLNLQE